MAYTIQTPRLGVQPIADTSTTQQMPLGTLVVATDPTYGTGEFIYMPGIASTVVGSIVTYNTTSFTTALAPVGTNLPQPIAIAMSANVANQYGWYQISGIAVAAKSISVSLVTGTAVGVKTIGVLNATATAVEVDGMLAASTATEAATTINVVIDRPHMTGRGTA